MLNTLIAFVVVLFITTLAVLIMQKTARKAGIYTPITNAVALELKALSTTVLVLLVLIGWATMMFILVKSILGG